MALVAPAEARAVAVVEALSPLAQPILAHLGLWADFLGQGHAASHRTFSAWGAPMLQRREHMLDVRGPSWRVDRGGFDQGLAMAAARGARRLAASVTGAQRQADGWRVALSDGGACSARLVIDATGRAAALARRALAPLRPLDRLVAAVAWLPAGDGPDELVVESFADGWWYSLGEARRGAGARRAVVCLTDTDIARALRLATPDGWRRALRETRFIDALAGGGEIDGRPILVPAAGRIASAAAGDDLLAVGDAALAVDPISGQGVARALRSGVFAAYAAADRLQRQDQAALPRYAAWAAREASAWTVGLAEHYGAETRWAERPVWRRRADPLPVA